MPALTGHTGDSRGRALGEPGPVSPQGRPTFDDPPVDRQVLDVFHGPDERRAWASASAADRQVLIELGWADADGELSARGRAVRRDLRQKSVTFAIGATGPAGELNGAAIAGARHALVFVEAQPRPWGWDNRPVTHEVRFLVIEAGALPIFLGRWAGLRPVLAEDADLEDVPTHLLEARLRDPATPPPLSAGSGLRRVWANPWVLWTLSCPAREIWLNYLDAGDCGQFRLGEGRPGQVRLIARPGSLVWGELLTTHRTPTQEPDGAPSW